MGGVRRGQIGSERGGSVWRVGLEPRCGVRRVQKRREYAYKNSKLCSKARVSDLAFEKNNHCCMLLAWSCFECCCVKSGKSIVTTSYGI